MSDRGQPRPAPPTLVLALAALTALLGAGMVLTALLGGGGIGSYGVLIGGLFLAAGLLRIKLIRGQLRAARAASDEEAPR